MIGKNIENDEYVKIKKNMIKNYYFLVRNQKKRDNWKKNKLKNLFLKKGFTDINTTPKDFL